MASSAIRFIRALASGEFEKTGAADWRSTFVRIGKPAGFCSASWSVEPPAAFSRLFHANEREPPQKWDASVKPDR